MCQLMHLPALSAAILNQIDFISNNGTYCIPEDVKKLTLLVNVFELARL